MDSNFNKITKVLTKKLNNKLTKSYGDSINGILTADDIYISSLTVREQDIIYGLREALAYQFRHVDKSCTTPEKVANECKDLRFKRVETLQVVLFNTKMNIIKRLSVAIGTNKGCNVQISQVFHEAIKYNANSIVLVHNHPSGNVEPSEADKDLTKELQKAGDVLNIPVLDHIIIGRNRAYSIKAEECIEYTM